MVIILLTVVDKFANDSSWAKTLIYAVQSLEGNRRTIVLPSYPQENSHNKADSRKVSLGYIDRVTQLASVKANIRATRHPETPAIVLPHF